MIIPNKLKTIEKYDFSHCEKRRAIEISEDSDLEKFCNKFFCLTGRIIFIPS